MQLTIDALIDTREPALLQFRAHNDNEADTGNRFLARPELVAINDNRAGAWIERDTKGKAMRVVRAQSRNPLACDTSYRAQPASPAAVPLTPATMARHQLDAWRAVAPANDSDIFGRAPRNKGGHDLAGHTSELGWWRTMSGGATDWDAVAADVANDDGPAKEETENEEIRPSINELVRCLPDETDAPEWNNGRIARLGGLRFATASKWLPDDEDADRVVARVAVKSKRSRKGWSTSSRLVNFAKARKPSNVSGPVRQMPWAGTLHSYQPKGRNGWSKPSESARQHRGGHGDRNSAYLFLLSANPLRPGNPGPERRRTKIELEAAWLVAQSCPPAKPYSITNNGDAFRRWLRTQDFGSGTVCPVGLPFQPTRLRELFMSGRTVPGAGTKDGSGKFERVRRNAPNVERRINALADAEEMVAFRSTHPSHAKVLDRAMTARTMADISAVSGAASGHTGKRNLVAACVALREFRKNYSASLQFLPSRAA